MRTGISAKLFMVSFIAVLCSVALLTAILTLTAAHTQNTAGDSKYEKSVIIDPGHGGVDGGAIGFDGTIEKDINLSIAQKLKNFFLMSGYEVIMIRTDDRSIHDKNSDTIHEKKVSDLHNRLKITSSHPNSILVSIHQNIYSSSRYSGTQVFYSPNNDDSKILATCLQTNIKKVLQPDNDRTIKKAGDNLFLLYNAHNPAVMVECGFLSNPEECKMLQTSTYQNQMAFAIYNGVLNFYSQ